MKFQEKYKNVMITEGQYVVSQADILNLLSDAKELELAKARIAELESLCCEWVNKAASTWSERDQLRAELAALKAQVPVAAIPAGYALMPSRIELGPEDIAAIMFMCGGDEDATEVDEQFNGGVLWVGNTVGDEGELTHGLHIACVECLEEGSTTIAEFAAPSPSTTEGQGDE